MKKLLSVLILGLFLPVFAGCEISNTDLANSLEGNMTRLVYSVGYLDSITTDELKGLVNSSSYFTHSYLYSNADASTTITNTSQETPVVEDGTTLEANPLEGGLSTTPATTSGRTAFQEASFRTATYSNGVTDKNTSNVGAYSSGVVDLSLLESNASDLNEILLEISTKRGIIMLYCTDLRSGKANLSPEDKAAISEYDDILKETTNYLNNNTGNLTNHFNGISSISGKENSAELINAKLIRANEVLKTRYAKLDTCLDSMNAIINIMVKSMGYDYSNLYNAPAETEIVETPSTSENPINNASVDNVATIDDFTCDNCNNQVTTYPMPRPAADNGAATNNCCPSTQSPATGDTIVNFNYDNTGGCCNNSNCTNTPNTPATLELNDEDYAQMNNIVAQEDIALSGGLTKGVQEEVIQPQNTESFVVDSTAEQKEGVQSTTQPNTLEIKPIDSPVVGHINLLPFKYQEDDVLKKIPR